MKSCWKGERFKKQHTEGTTTQIPSTFRVASEFYLFEYFDWKLPSDNPNPDSITVEIEPLMEKRFKKKEDFTEEKHQKLISKRNCFAIHFLPAAHIICLLMGIIP